jgi:tRNA (cytidine56-2'-O)-methyltransferase
VITVLRLGHRLGRDDRISTHCGLVARALGADSIIYSGDHDGAVMESIRNTAERWGGKFSASYEQSWKKVLVSHRKRGYAVVHATMYGLPLQHAMEDIRKKRKILFVIGGEKVPAELYALSDFNIAIGSQPHSEVAALAVFLHEYFQGKELGKSFRGKLRIVPQARGKKVLEK